MNFIIADPIFTEFPDVVIGIVIAHDLDNRQDKVEITQLLRDAEAALPGKVGDTPLIQHPLIAP